MGQSCPEPSRARLFAGHRSRALAWSTSAGTQDSGRPLRGHPVRSYRLGNRTACRRLLKVVCEKPQRRIGRCADRGNGFPPWLGAMDTKSPSLPNERPCLLLRTMTVGLVGLGRLELPTSPLSGARSSHLSYRPLTHGRYRDNLTSLRCITANRNRVQTQVCAFRTPR
jgi:hypothetical protein